MAFVNSEGKSISYECDYLIDELKADIEEFGKDKIVAVWCTKKDGVTIYTNYDFIDNEAPITKAELGEGEYIEQMPMIKLLALLRKQNEIF